MLVRMHPPIDGLREAAHVLVTGATSGIGLAALRRLLAQDTVARVHAVGRRAGATPDLAALAERAGDRLRLHAADLADPAAIESLGRQVAETGPRLHLVFNAAGMLHGPGLRPEKALAQVKPEGLMQLFAVNAFAPILLAKALLPLLRGDHPCVFASLSARVGSIGDNALGGWYAYRAAKAAQNQLVRTLAVEMKRLNPRAACVLLHPGTVATPLSAPFSANVPAEKLFTPERAAGHLLDIVATLGPEDTGRFIAWDGTDIPW
jgi:NAD(P)-dependent dehydrogenase (short-subunit alcohol dehydrogenase family)